MFKVHYPSSDWRIMSLINGMSPWEGLLIADFEQVRIVFLIDEEHELSLAIEKNIGPDLLGGPCWEEVECPIELRPIIRYHFEQFLQNYAASLPGERSEADGSS